MIVFYVPTRTTTCMVIGLLPADLELMNRGVEPPQIHMDAAVREGIAIPSVLQIIICQDEFEFEARLRRAIVGTDGEPIADLRFGELENRGLEDDRG